MLADDDGPLLTGLEVFRQAQPAPGKDIVPHIHRHLEDRDLVGLTQEAASGIHRQVRIWHAADDFVPEAVALLRGMHFKVRD
ncbi:MAG: hypothetical protein B7Z16_18240 [Algoriphagus sp. 32-45-6]|nr:MAG: hypothetical protein B7Z16_18240 [Algoriphagus sp. 32-45-6]